MFKKSLIGRNCITKLAAVAAIAQLPLLMGVSGGGGGGGCTPTDTQDLIDILDGAGPVTPTGTGGPATPTTPVQPLPITAGIAASKSSGINPGETITFSAVSVAGGTPPYTYYWMMDHDAGWTTSGPSFSSLIDDSAETRTVTLVVRDSTNTDSNYFSFSVTLAQQLTPAVNTVCGDMSGEWGTTYGVMMLTHTGSTVSGTYDYFGCIGTIMGTLSLDPDTRNSCPSCMRWEGTWAEVGGSCSGQGGSFQFSVDPDLSHFNGRWSKDPNTHWQADFWSGNHNKCGDGSEPGPRP